MLGHRRLVNGGRRGNDERLKTFDVNRGDSLVHWELPVRQLVECALLILTHRPNPTFIFTVASSCNGRAWTPATGVWSLDKAPLHIELAGLVRKLPDVDTPTVLPQRRSS